MGVGHSHSHDHGRLDAVPIPRGPRLTLIGLLVVGAIATVVGLMTLWPSGSAVDAVSRASAAQYAAPGVTFPSGTVHSIGRACKAAEQPEQSAQATGGACGQVGVRITRGASSGQSVTIQVIGPVSAALSVGDDIEVMRIPGQGGSPDSYSFVGVDRNAPLLWLVGLFVVVVVAVARLRGVLAILGLVVAGLVVVKFLLPALLSGRSGVAVALVGAAAIMYVVLYLAHGVSVRTSAALAGTLVGVGITALVAQWFVSFSRLSGLGDETSQMLSSMVGTLDFQGLLAAAVIIAGLGVLNDVTITQASAVWELREAGPSLSRRELFASGMRIGRDHIASTIYTIVFAYAGAALSVLLVLYLYDRPMLELLGTEEIGGEVVRTLCSAVGLVLAVPATTAIAALTVGGPVAERPATYVGRRRAS